MRVPRKKLFICGISLLLLSTSTQISMGSELVYRFNNPSFGGNPLTGNYLLSTATAQNDFEEDKNRDPLADFEEQLTRRILSDISRKITQDAFGEDELEAGYYTIGDFIIDITTGSGGGVAVEIQDTSTGNRTTVEVPGY